MSNLATQHFKSADSPRTWLMCSSLHILLIAHTLTSSHLQVGSSGVGLCQATSGAAARPFGGGHVRPQQGGNRCADLCRLVCATGVRYICSTCQCSAMHSRAGQGSTNQLFQGGFGSRAGCIQNRNQVAVVQAARCNRAASGVMQLESAAVVAAIHKADPS